MIEIPHEIMEAYDRKMAAIHECGHAVVARHYGLMVYPRIWRAEIDADIEESFPELDSKIWRGRLEVLAGRPTPQKMRRVCMAGVFAEIIDRDGSSPEFDESFLEDLMRSATEEAEEFGDTEEWSPTDWEHAKHWKPRDVHAVYTILVKNWNALRREAEDLIVMGKDSPAAFRIPVE